MAGKAINFLEERQSETPSRFAEEAAWRKENAGRLRWSRQLAVTLIGYMQDNGLKRADLEALLGVSPQYVSKLLSGTENYLMRDYFLPQQHSIGLQELKRGTPFTDVNRMNNDIFYARYFYLQFLRSFIQRIGIQSGHKNTAQSKYRRSGGPLQGYVLRTCL